MAFLAVNGYLCKIGGARIGLRLVALVMAFQHVYYAWYLGEMHELHFLSMLGIMVCSIKLGERFFFQGPQKPKLRM